MFDSQPRRRRIKFEPSLIDESYVEVSIANGGTGISDNKLREVFETFYTTKAQGTGLGQSITRTIVEFCGGKIWAENLQGGEAPGAKQCHD